MIDIASRELRKGVENAGELMMTDKTRGFLYVISNQSMPGLLKIGYTKRSISQRLSQLRSTGVPSRFVAELVFEIDNAADGEKLVHLALRKYRFDREFFKISIKQAVKVSKSVLLKAGITVYKVDGRAKSEFLTAKERLEWKAVHEERETASRRASQMRAKLVAQAKLHREEFLATAPRVEALLRKKSRYGRGGILGMFAPNPFDDGVTVGESLSKEEANLIKAFHECILGLRHTNSFQDIGWADPDEFLIKWVGVLGMRKPSELLNGVFSGLGLRLLN
jgi:hypothetical protein